MSSCATLTLPQLRARKVVFIPLLIPQPDWDKYHFNSTSPLVADSAPGTSDRHSAGRGHRPSSAPRAAEGAQSAPCALLRMLRAMPSSVLLGVAAAPAAAKCCTTTDLTLILTLPLTLTLTLTLLFFLYTL